MLRRITLDCRFSRWETAQTVYTRYLEPGEKGEEAAEGCSRRGASARTGGIYNKKKNINGKREANEKNEKDVWRPQRRLEGRRKMRTILLAPLQPRRKWGERDGRMSCITRGVRCIQRIRMHHARKEMANEGFGDHVVRRVGEGIGCERRQ